MISMKTLWWQPLYLVQFRSVQPLSHVRLFATPWTAARQASHQLPEYIQTHIHRVSDAIQSSHPLSSPSLALNLSQHQSLPKSQLFAWGGQSARTSALASVLPMNIQGWFPLGLTDLISLLSEGLSRVFSSTTVQKHQFLGSVFFIV